MGSKNSKGKASTRHKRHAAQAGDSGRCWALMVADSSRIRRRALADCQRARTTFKKAEIELEVFQSRDKPAFVRWYRAEFGPKIEELKTCVNGIHAWRGRMERLRRFADLKRCGLREAARIFDRSIEEFERIEAALHERAAREEEEARRRREKKIEELKEDALQHMLAFLKFERAEIRRLLNRRIPAVEILKDIAYSIAFDTGIPADLLWELLRRPECAPVLKAVGLEGALDDAMDSEEEDLEDDGFIEDVFGRPLRDPFSDPPLRPPVEKSADQEARIKVLWRELAFALHPDQSDSATDPAKLDLWHQVQEAMAARDLDRLEVLHAHLQVLRGELSPHAPVSRLMALTAMYRESRDALRRRIRELRKNVEWGFSASGEERRGRLKIEMAEQLRIEIERAREELARLRWEYEQDFSAAPGQMTFTGMR